MAHISMVMIAAVLFSVHPLLELKTSGGTSPTTAPSERCCYAMAYDAGRGGRAVRRQHGLSRSKQRDVGMEWSGPSELDSTDCVEDRLPAQLRLAFDESRGVCVLFGGLLGAQEEATRPGNGMAVLGPHRLSTVHRPAKPLPWRMTRLATSLSFSGVTHRFQARRGMEWFGWTQRPVSGPSPMYHAWRMTRCAESQCSLVASMETEEQRTAKRGSGTIELDAAERARPVTAHVLSLWTTTSRATLRSSSEAREGLSGTAIPGMGWNHLDPPR